MYLQITGFQQLLNYFDSWKLINKIKQIRNVKI